MMLIFRSILCLICFAFVSCSKSNPPQKKSEKVALADKVSRECAKTLSKKYGMAQCGEGGKMMYEIESLFLAFQIYRPLSKEKAREILIDCAHEVISSVNNNQEIQKYLLPGGFNEKSVQIQIYIKPDHKTPYFPDLSVCAYNFGKLGYHTNDPEDEYRYKTSERETYEEAIALLGGEVVEGGLRESE